MADKVIFDLDGTLADCTHRVPLLPNWDEFYSACFDDVLIRPIANIYRQLTEDYDELYWEVYLWSGRRYSEYDKTRMWFDKHRLEFPSDSRVQMRPDHDHRPDTELKGQWLDECGFTPSLVFEDRTSVVNMYRERGIQVCQVAPGDF